MCSGVISQIEKPIYKALLLEWNGRIVLRITAGLRSEEILRDLRDWYTFLRISALFDK